MSTANTVVHEPARKRFELWLTEESGLAASLAGWAAYEPVGQARQFTETFIKPEYRGRGLSGQLIGQAVAATREEGWDIVATCSAVEHFLATHPHA